MNKKVVCDCDGKPLPERYSQPGTFFLMPSFNNRFAFTSICSAPVSSPP